VSNPVLGSVTPKHTLQVPSIILGIVVSNCSLFPNLANG
jgi:hypothetical protein